MKFLPPILLLIFCLQLSAQDPVHRVYNNLNGLPSNTVYNILQDQKGFIWLAHDKGLSRFDGKQLLNLNNTSAQSKSLSNLIEIDGNIWCQDFAGNFYQTKQHNQLTPTNFKTPGVYTAAGFINNTLVSVKYDSIRTFNITKQQQQAFTLKKLIHQATYFEGDRAYFIDANVLTSFHSNKTTSVFTLPNTNNIFNFLIKCNQNFFAITRTTYPYVHLLSNNKIESLPYLPKGSFVQDVIVIKNEIWICTSKGAYCFNTNFTPKYNGRCFFTNYSISKVYIDREGNYWFGTLNNGVLIIPNINAQLFTYQNQGFTSITNNQNNLLVGTTTNGVMNFNIPSNNFNAVFSLANNHEVLNILHNTATQQTYVSSNQLTILKNNQLIAGINIAAKKVVHVNKDLLAVAYASGIALLSNQPKLSIQQIPKWLQTNGSRIEENVYKLLLQSGRCRDVLFDSATQTLYAATANGLLYFSPNGRGEIKNNNDAIYAAHLSSSNNTIYAATYSQGIMCITQQQLSYTIPITNNAIYKIYPYQNSLFLIADDGLIQYNLSTKKKTIFSYADGLPKAEIKDILVRNNQIYIATSVGLVVFKITDKKINTVPPLIQLNKILVNGENNIWKNNVRLKADQNNISIHFSALSFKSEDGNKILYKINKENWQTLEVNSGVINLPSLSANKYTLVIKAVNEDNIETIQPLEINFSIQAPFYKQLWFIALIIALIGSIIYVYFKIRLRNQQEQNNLLAQKIQLEQELQQSMLASIKSQMNPHFLFNALNTIQSYIYTNEKENASEYLGKFSELTRMILDMSNKPAVSVATEIKALTLYLQLEKQRFEDKLHYTLTVSDAISQETSYIPSMIIQPYVENAIKHGLLHSKNQWLLTIDFTKSKEAIMVTIDDNGIGRKRSEELNKQKALKHQSFSTTANKTRLEILNKGFNSAITVDVQDKTDEHGFATGTRITLNIPFILPSTSNKNGLS